jgi:RNA polymerase sigma factor (sigma-70 family)
MTTIEFKTHILSLDQQLKHYAFRLTSNQDDALDLCQDTVLKAITYRAKFTHSNLKAWIFTIMKNIFINAYRRKVKQREWMLNETNIHRGILNVSNDNPISTQNYNDIIQEFNKLEYSIREPFKMYLEGYKYREIADDLNLPIGTIKSRIFQGRRILMESLKEFVN